MLKEIKVQQTQAYDPELYPGPGLYLSNDGIEKIPMFVYESDGVKFCWGLCPSERTDEFMELLTEAYGQNPSAKLKDALETIDILEKENKELTKRLVDQTEKKDPTEMERSEPIMTVHMTKQELTQISAELGAIELSTYTYEDGNPMGVILDLAGVISVASYRMEQSLDQLNRLIDKL